MCGAWRRNRNKNRNRESEGSGVRRLLVVGGRRKESFGWTMKGED